MFGDRKGIHHVASSCSDPSVVSSACCCMFTTPEVEKTITPPETNELPMKIPIFPGKYHQNGGFSMAMLVSGRVMGKEMEDLWTFQNVATIEGNHPLCSHKKVTVQSHEDLDQKT